jgi:amidohydrolase family protein
VDSLRGTVAYIRQTFYDAIHYRDEIDRYQRVKRGVPRPEHDRKLSALLPVLRGELPVLFVANSDGDSRRALMIADEFKLKPIVAGAMYGYRVVDLLKSKNVPVILSVDFPRRSVDAPEDDEEPLRLLRDRAEAPKGAARLAQAGVRFAFMSGTLRPQDFIANVQKAVENGLSKEEALRALTVRAAEILGASEQLGSIEVGKIANLVVANGDLLSKDTKVRHVFIDGDEIELKKPEPSSQRGPGLGGRPVPAGGAIDPTGLWELQVNTPGGEVSVRLAIQRDGDRLSGTVSGPTGTNPIQNATLAGNQLRFTVAIQMGAEPTDATVNGTIEGNTIRGTISLAAMGAVEFTGHRPR